MISRARLLDEGYALLVKWCDLNGVSIPEVKRWYTDAPFDACAYYRGGVINIWPNECASIGTNVRQWSYPGYVIDRTPYGVLQHELGHHADQAYNYRGGIYSQDWRKETGEAAITGYCTNDMEWFAEIFRLFVTNPDLLAKLRPRTFTKLINQWPQRAENRRWEQVLFTAPERWIRATQNKIKQVQPRSQGELYA
jgi:hypothetical protein